MEDSRRTPPLDQLNQLLVGLCRHEPAVSSKLAGEMLADGARRGRFLEHARNHRVLGLSLTALERSRLLETLPAGDRRELVFLLLGVRCFSALYASELTGVVKTLTADGIDHVVLKGGGLGHTAYRDPAERDLADLDILVEDDKFDRTLELMEQLGYDNPWSADAIRGYRKFHYHVPLRRKDGRVVEIHWGLVKPERSYRLDSTAFLRDAMTVQAGELRLRMPRPEHLLLHVAVQQVQDAFSYLGRSVDIDRIVRHWPGLDWDRVVGDSIAGNLGPTMATSLQLSRLLFGADIPAEAVERLGPRRVARLHLTLLLPVQSALWQRYRRRQTTSRLLRLWLLPGARRIGRAVFSIVAAREDHEPLRRPWELDAPPTRRWHNPLAGSWSMLKLVGLQLGIYIWALASMVTASGRQRIRFWSASASS